MKNKRRLLTRPKVILFIFTFFGTLSSCKNYEEQSNFSNISRLGDQTSFRLLIGNNDRFLIQWSDRDLAQINLIATKSSLTLPIPRPGTISEVDIRSFEFDLIFSVNSGELVCQAMKAKANQSNEAYCLSFEKACTNENWGHLSSKTSCECQFQSFTKTQYLDSSIAAAKNNRTVDFICVNDRRPSAPKTTPSLSASPLPTTTATAEEIKNLNDFKSQCTNATGTFDGTKNICTCNGNTIEYKNQKIADSAFSVCNGD